MQLDVTKSLTYFNSQTGFLTRIHLKRNGQGSYPFMNKNSRIFKDTFPIFQGLHSVQKKTLESMSFFVLPQHE